MSDGSLSRYFRHLRGHAHAADQNIALEDDIGGIAYGDADQLHGHSRGGDDVLTGGARGFVITDERFETASPGIFEIRAVRSGFSGRPTQAVAEATTAVELAAICCEA